MTEILLLLAGTVSVVEGVSAEWRGRRTKAKILIIGGVAMALYALSHIHQSIFANLPH